MEEIINAIKKQQFLQLIHQELIEDGHNCTYNAQENPNTIIITQNKRRYFIALINNALTIRYYPDAKELDLSDPNLFTNIKELVTHPW